MLNCSTYSGRRRVGQFVTKNSAIEYCGVEVKSTNIGPDTILLSPYGTQFDTRTDVIMIGSQCSHGPDRKIRPCAPQHLDSCAASSGLPCLLVSSFCTWTVANLALSQKGNFVTGPAIAPVRRRSTGTGKFFIVYCRRDDYTKKRCFQRLTVVFV